ncbi:MAG TPA: hypothetical protein VIN11_04485 [Roseivirga sp.]
MDKIEILKSFIQQNKRVLLWVASIIGVVFLVILFYRAASPIQKLKEWSSFAEAEGFSIDNVSELDSIQRQIAFKKSLLTLTGKDSIHMVINLPDSSIGLFMNGLIIFKTQITRMELDPLLKRLSPQLYGHQFSKGIKADTVRSTIIKEPIIEKVAPKTQEEFLASVTLPDSVVFEPVYLEFQLSNGIQLHLEQNEIHGQADIKTKRRFYRPNRRDGWMEMLYSAVTFKAPEYKAQIRLEANQAELTSIYRALPAKPKVVISY